jgi:DNA-binding transcriptional ArsR family regulator
VRKNLDATSADFCFDDLRRYGMLLQKGTWRTDYTNNTLALRALASDRRLKILGWLKEPTKHSPPQVGGDLVEDGACSCLIAPKLGVSQPTTSEHLKILSQAKLLRSKK